MAKLGELELANEVFELLIEKGVPVPLRDLYRVFSKQDGNDSEGFTYNALKERLQKMVKAGWLHERADGYMIDSRLLRLSVRARESYARGSRSLVELIQACG